MMKHKQSKRAHILRATIANITPEGLALKLAEHNDMFPGLSINASLNASINVSLQWGEECGTTLETTATWRSLAMFLLGILEDLYEEAAYITQDGSQAFLLWSDGTLEEL